MPLVIHKFRQHDQDVFGPCVICDHCGQEITRAADGNVEWEAPEAGRDSWPLVFTHKRCCLPWEDAHGGRGRWWTFELESLPVFLVRGLGIAWDAARGRAAMLGGI